MIRPIRQPQRFQALDLLATLVAVVEADGHVLYANSALEDAIGISRRSIEGSVLFHAFTQPQLLQNALEGARGNEFATLRYDAWLNRQHRDAMPVHVIVAQTDRAGEFLVEMLPQEQQ